MYDTDDVIYEVTDAPWILLDNGEYFKYPREVAQYSHQLSSIAIMIPLLHNVRWIFCKDLGCPHNILIEYQSNL